jgi:hypothetical protein
LLFVSFILHKHFEFNSTTSCSPSRAVAQGAQVGRGDESFVACCQESNSAIKPSGADGTVESLDAFAVSASLLVGFDDRFTNSDSNASW